MSYLPLTAGEVCTPDVVATERDTRVSEAARLMHTHHVGSLVVVDDLSPGKRRVVGMLTDRDITVAVVAAEQDPHRTRVGEIMSKDVVAARVEDSVLDLLELMRRKRVRRLPIIGSQGELIGILTLDDVMSVVAEEMHALAGAIGAARRKNSEPGA